MSVGNTGHRGLKVALVVFALLILIGAIGGGGSRGNDSEVASSQGSQQAEQTQQEAAVGELSYTVDTGGAPTDDYPLYLRGIGDSDVKISPSGGSVSLGLGAYAPVSANPYWIASDGSLLKSGEVSPSTVDLNANGAQVSVSLQKVDPSTTSRDEYQQGIDSACSYIATHEGQDRADELRALATALLPAENAPPAGALTVHYLDVGQGDSELLELPDGKLMLIDAGTQEAGPTVVQAIRALGKTRIDYLVATHPHADHIGGMAEVIRAFDIGEVWAPNVTTNTRTFESFTGAVAAKGLSINAASKGKDIVAPGNTSYDIQILGPSDSVSSEDLNDYSLIIRVRYGSTSFLFTGDAPKDEIRADVGEHVDVLKVAHHGSDTGTDAALAAQLSPKMAVISYGIGNDYGHPKQGVLDALASSGAQVFGTGANGTVTVTSDGTNVQTSTEREGAVVAGSSESSQSSADSSGGTAAAAAPAPAASTSTDTGADDIVYVTKSGKKYHRQDCRTIAKSKGVVSMTRSQAEAQGLSACKVCNP